MFLGKLPFGGEKMHFTQKQKLFQKLWAVVKQMKKYFFLKYYFGGGGLRGLKIGKKAQNDLIQEPQTPPKNIFLKKLVDIILRAIKSTLTYVALPLSQHPVLTVSRAITLYCNGCPYKWIKAFQAHQVSLQMVA